MQKSDEVEVTRKAMLSLLIIDLITVLFAYFIQHGTGINVQGMGTLTSFQSTLNSTTTSMSHAFTIDAPNTNDWFGYLAYFINIIYHLGTFLFDIILIMAAGIGLMLFMLFYFIPSMVNVSLGGIGAIVAAFYLAVTLILTMYGYVIVRDNLSKFLHGGGK
jgi:hypothetical protein